MSLFRLIEAYNYNVANSSTFAVGNLVEGDRDQVVIGGEDGLVTILDPAVSLQSTEESIIAQHQTDQPVIQIAIGSFLQLDDPVVAVLHSHSLAFYTLRYDAHEQANTTFQLAFTHDIGEPAYCMCVVDEDRPAQILVETISCRLHLFQGDQCLFSRASLPALFPGPIAYHHTTSALNIACGYHIYSVKFSLLSSLGNSGKKISFDWSFNCGDWPLQVFAIDYAPAPPSVLVVARRNVFCLPAMEPDRIKWQIRLETIAVASHAYRCGDEAEIRFLVATVSNTMLVFKEEQLLWNCHMDFCPTVFCRSSVSSLCMHMLAMLSSDGRFVIGHLGTEPHLFKPTHDNRAIDLHDMVEELKELEKRIGGKPDAAITQTLNKPFTLLLEVDHDRMEPVSRGELPNIPIRVVAQDVPVGNSVELSVYSCLVDTTRKLSPNSMSVSLRVGKKIPWTSSIDLVAICTPSHATSVSKLRLPLNCIVAEATPERNSDLKITIEMDRHTIPLHQLFPEFNTENPSSIAFQAYGPCDSSVSVFTANKTNRYRIQSDKMELLALITRELVERLRTNDSNIQLNSRPPLEYLQSRVEKQIEMEASIKKLLAELEKASLELRAIQALVISKTQNTKQEGMDNVDCLYKRSHEQLLTLVEKIAQKKRDKDSMENELSAVFDLIALVGEIGRQETLVDGYFYGYTQQSLIERLAWATRKTELLESLEVLCRHTSKSLPQIAEDEEREEMEPETEDAT